MTAEIPFFGGKKGFRRELFLIKSYCGDLKSFKFATEVQLLLVSKLIKISQGEELENKWGQAPSTPLVTVLAGFKNTLQCTIHNLRADS